MRALVCGSVLLTLAAPALTAQTFEGETTVLAVEVPVRVLVRGQPVRGLTAENFALRDRGELREIIDFEVLDLASASSPEQDEEAALAPVPTARNFLFLFDFAYGGGGPADTRRRLTGSLAALRSHVFEGGLGPSDRAAIAYFSPLRGLKLLLDFTADRDRLGRALGALGLVITQRPRELAQAYSDWAALAPPRRGWRNKTPHGPVEASLDDLVAEARISLFRGDALLPHGSLLMHLSRDLRRLSGQSRLTGPRYLVLFSMGPLYGDEDTRARALMGEIIEAFRRDSWSVESIDTGGLGFGRDSLLLLAKETGGRLYTNSRKLDLLMEEMAESTEVSYLLTFQADGVPIDGAYHHLRVELVNGPAGAKVVHRPGYYAPSATDLIAPR